eukprot:GFYU01003836.1.p1 GENE.GFYU01003836.1~~GFYU01003836.1.p1  ORF type:complete len:399 (+),score=84.47 GFYU01003836.1:127-1323(+)
MASKSKPSSSALRAERRKLEMEVKEKEDALELARTLMVATRVDEYKPRWGTSGMDDTGGSVGGRSRSSTLASSVGGVTRLTPEELSRSGTIGKNLGQRPNLQLLRGPAGRDSVESEDDLRLSTSLRISSMSTTTAPSTAEQFLSDVPKTFKRPITAGPDPTLNTRARPSASSSHSSKSVRFTASTERHKTHSHGQRPSTAPGGGRPRVDLEELYGTKDNVLHQRDLFDPKKRLETKWEKKARLKYEAERRVQWEHKHREAPYLPLDNRHYESLEKFGAYDWDQARGTSSVVDSRETIDQRKDDLVGYFEGWISSQQQKLKYTQGTLEKKMAMKSTPYTHSQSVAPPRSRYDEAHVKYHSTSGSTKSHYKNEHEKMMYMQSLENDIYRVNRSYQQQYHV